ncbi:MAG: SPOR domain-containing protein [Candidatus Zixiibacteriota bacterium]
MKSFANSYNSFLLGLLLVLAGCSKSPESGEETKTEETSVSTNSHTKLDPLELPQDTRIIPQLQPHKGEIKGTGTPPEVNKDTAGQIQTQLKTNIKPQIDTLSSQALRIQLHSTELFGEAKRERQIAEEIFDQPVYLDYEVPYYKVRVGSFAERKSAEFYLQKAKTAGYQNAWIVAVRVNVKEAQSLYDNLPVPKMEAGQGK